VRCYAPGHVPVGCVVRQSNARAKLHAGKILTPHFNNTEKKPVHCKGSSHTCIAINKITTQQYAYFVH
jgi:hypothetical protein